MAARTKRSKKNQSTQLNLGQMEALLELMKKNQIGELEWEKGGERVRLKSQEGIAAEFFGRAFSMPSALPSPRPASQEATVVESTPSPSSVSANQAANQKQVLSPFVGTFYRSASPNADPYVKEGQAIKRGEVLCIVEAMKLMNEIEAEFPGKVLSVLVENGQPVEYGEPLFVIEI